MLSASYEVESRTTPERPVWLLVLDLLHRAAKWVARPVWVSEKSREEPTAALLWRARWYRRFGAGIIFVVPLFVSYGSITEFIHKMHDEPSRQFYVWGLFATLLVAVLHAWYAWFITGLLLFDARLERIRIQDVVLPSVLALAYLFFALEGHFEIRHHFQVEQNKVQSVQPTPLHQDNSVADAPNVRKESEWVYLFRDKLSLWLFLLLYGGWTLRDSLELAELRAAEGNYEAKKHVVRWIWLIIDSLQVVVIASSIGSHLINDNFDYTANFKWGRMSAVGEAFTVALAAMGSLLVWGVTRAMSRGSEIVWFPSFLKQTQVRHSDWLKNLKRKVDWMSEEIVLVDIGASDGTRTRQVLQALIRAGFTPKEVLGIEVSQTLTREFHQNIAPLMAKRLVRYCNLEEVKKLTVSGPIVLHVSHLDFRPTFMNLGSKSVALLKAILRKQLLSSTSLAGVIWRGPAPGSVEHTLAVMGSSNRGSPELDHLWHEVYVRELMEPTGLPVVWADHQRGQKAFVVPQSLNVDAGFLWVLNWLSLGRPGHTAERADYWLRKFRSFRAVPDEDFVFIYANPAPCPGPFSTECGSVPFTDPTQASGSSGPQCAGTISETAAKPLQQWAGGNTLRTVGPTA